MAKMRNGVVKRGSTWSYKIEHRDPVTGKHRAKWVGGFATQRKASAARVKALEEKRTGGVIEPTRDDVSTFVTRWLTAIKPSLAPSTWRSYERNLRLHVLPRVGSVRLAELDGLLLSELYAELGDAGARRDSKPGGLSARTVAYISTIVSAALDDACRWQLLARNVAKDADKPKQKAGTSKVQAWDAPTLARFLACSAHYQGKGSKSKGGPGDRLFALWTFLATTGCRRGEALGLRWSDVDLRAGTAAIRQTVVNVGDAIVISEPKAKSTRLLSLDPGTVKVLRTWHARQGEERMLLGSGYRDQGLVFATPIGEPLHPNRVSREFTRRVGYFDLPPLSLHGLRHTWATLALQRGVHVKVVQHQLGHSTPMITMQTYMHVSPSIAGDAVELIAAEILPG